MTTIALDSDLNLASDSLACLNGVKSQHPFQKVWNIDNYLIGVAGGYAEALVFVDYLSKLIEHNCVQSYTELEIPKPVVDYLDDFFAIMVSPKGEVLFWESSALSFQTQAPLAIGSGAPYALAAMECGKTAEEAVAIACKFDPYFGGEIQSVKFEPETDLEELSKDELIKLIRGEESE